MQERGGRWTCIIFATATQECLSSPYPPSSCFPSDPQDTITLKALWESQNTPYHIPIFPQAWSVSECFLWLTITALIKAKHFRILGLIYCFCSWKGFCQPFERYGQIHLTLCRDYWTGFLYASYANVYKPHLTEVLGLECLNISYSLFFVWI